MSEPQTPQDDSDRLPVQKTFKLYIGGQFPRTESGRHYVPVPGRTPLGNICQSSRKDFRNAVVAARAVQPDWAGRSAFNRGQILYRIGEMLEGRKSQFVDELARQGLAPDAAAAETETAIDRWIHYAGWCDKYQQIFSSVNPVASSHFNFSLLEPTGVVGMLASPDSPLLGLVSLMAPIVAGGNTCVVLASEDRPLSAITLAEVLHSSDLPGGVVNILTGYREELAEHFASHMDLNSVAIDHGPPELIQQMQTLAAGNVKRFRQYDRDWSDPENQNPYLIQDFCELKTTWHPIEQIGPAGSGY